MEENEESVQANGSKTLLVRHLPADLTGEEKEELLKYFGAEAVRLFSNTGRMVNVAFFILNPLQSTFTFEPPSLCPQKHTAFAQFRSERAAASVSYSCYSLSLLFVQFNLNHFKALRNDCVF